MSFSALRSEIMGGGRTPIPTIGRLRGPFPLAPYPSLAETMIEKIIFDKKKNLTQNCKNLKSKMFFLVNFFPWTLPFFRKNDQNSEICQSQKIFVRKVILIGNDSVRMFQNVFQIENLEIENFFRVICFLGLSHFLPKFDANSSPPSFVLV